MAWVVGNFIIDVVVESGSAVTLSGVVIADVGITERLVFLDFLLFLRRQFRWPFKVP
ncbi:MAG: hypothetical protein P8K83_02180 [Woeseiaceae bacterium]|nr:hypothetical protein [Woeseiaceae bacterium]